MMLCLGVLFVLVWKFDAATASNITLYCPQPFAEVGTNNVTAIVDTTDIGQCNVSPVNTFNFTVTLQDGTKVYPCGQAYSVCDTTTNNQGCRCVGQTGSLLTYQFDFVFDKATHEGGTMDLRPFGCVSLGPYPFTHFPCNLRGSPPTTSPPESTSESTTVPPSNGSCDINNTVGIETCTLNNGPHSGWVISGSDMLRWDFQNSKVVVLCYCCKEWVEAVIPVVYCLVSLIFCGILLIWRRPFFDDTWERWQILICVIGFIVWFNLGPVWFITYMTTAGVCGYYPFDKCTCNCIETTPPILPDCPRDDEHPDWEYAVFCLGLIFLLAFCLYFIVTICKKWWPFQPDTEKRLIVRLQLGAAQSGSARFYKLLVKCGKCHKWRLFSVALDDKLQNIFIQENLNEIFKKCANHGQEEFDLQEVEQKLEEIFPQYQNVTLQQTICLKDDSRDKWYKQHHKPNKAVLDAVMKGTWSWSEGFGTEVDQTGMTEVLQIRLYLLSTSAFREDGGAIEMRRVDDVSSGAQ